MTAAGLALVILLATGDVRAESLRRWDAALRAGYGATWTTGIPYLGFGLGASAGYVFPRRLRIEGVLLWSAGQVQEASTTTLSYRSSQSSWRGTMGVFYELGRGSVQIGRAHV